MTNPESTPQHLWLIPYLIVLTTSLSLAAGNIYMPSLPQMATYFGCTTNSLLASVSIFYLGFASSGLIYGALGDYFGRRPSLICGFSIFLIGSLTCLFATNLRSFMTGSLLEGVGGAASLIIGLAAIQDIFTAEKSVKTLGWMGALLVVMPALSPIAGGYLAIIGWRCNYGVIFIIGTILLLLLVKYFFETASINDTHRSGIIKRSLLSYLTVLKHTGFLRYGSIYPVLIVGTTALLTSAPIYIMQTLGFDSKTCGYLIGFMTIGYAFGGLAAAKLVSKYGIKCTLKIGIFTSLTSAFLVTSILFCASNKLAFLLPAFLLQCGIAMTHAPSTTTAVRYFSDLRASASAMRGTFSIVGSALGAALAAYIGSINIAYIATISILTSLVSLLLSIDNQKSTKP